MNIILVGHGAWGINYVKTIDSFFPQIKLKVADRTNWKQLIDEKPQGVIIVTPPSSHIEIAKHALVQNIPCLIEKPLALSLAEAKELEQFGHVPKLVGHTYLFSNWYQKLKEITDGQKITKISSFGYNQGPIRDYTSLWDYGPHDLSMILDLLGQTPSSVNIIKNKQKHGALYNIELGFTKDTINTVSVVGNGAFYKRRQITVHFDKFSISHDDTINLKVNEVTTPMQNMLEVFFGGIEGKSDYRFGLQQSFDILEILENCKK